MRNDIRKRVEAYLESHPYNGRYYTASFVIACEDLPDIKVGGVVEAILFGGVRLTPRTVDDDGLISEWVRY